MCKILSLTLSTILLFTAILPIGLLGCSNNTPTTLNVSAAASLTDALKEINSLYSQKNTNITISQNFASSGILQKQIEQGAPCDVFISAAASQMDALENGNLLLNDTRKDLLNNRVVLIIPIDSTLDITNFTDLTRNSVKKIAIGDPEFVPAGTYGKQALDQLGLTSQLRSKLILGSDVRQVLNYVETGNVDAGIVYSTDTIVSTKVKIVADAPAVINDKIVYPVAIIKASKNVDAAQHYIDFLFTNEVRTVFEKYGFKMVNH